MTHKTGSAAACVAGVALLTLGLAITAPAAASPSDQADPSVCASMDNAVYQRVKPTNDASLLTPWAKEAKGSAAYGFTQDDGVLFDASHYPGPGLVEVHRLYRAHGLDFSASVKADEIAEATENGYQDQGKTFYASAAPAACLVPVYRYVKDTKHRFAVTSTERVGLEDDGWASEGPAFYAVPAEKDEGGADPDPTSTPAPASDTDTDTDTDTDFSFAVYPDTQQEVFGGKRFVDRANWLAAHKSELDLRFLTHTGDVVNWDTDDHAQYEVASEAMKPLEASKIPYSMAIGNHDTQATGPGGGARDPKRTRVLQRDTHVFNDYFTASRYGGVTGAFEKGKVDNVYSLYEAGGDQWMVLVLELWPRQAVVDWAKQVVAEHPDSNVIVVTHDYLDPNGELEQSAGYGDTSPQQLYDEFVRQYPNIRMVLSGHVGVTAHRVDTGKAGNKIYSFMTTIHSSKTNPIRLFTIDTEKGTLKTRVYAPYTDETWSEATETISGIDWVH